MTPLSTRTIAYFRAAALIERAAGNFDLANDFEETANGGEAMCGRTPGWAAGALNSTTVSTAAAIAALDLLMIGLTT